MKNLRRRLFNNRGDMNFGTGVLLWLIGIPLPVILLLSMMRGCR